MCRDEHIHVVDLQEAELPDRLPDFAHVDTPAGTRAIKALRRKREPTSFVQREIVFQHRAVLNLESTPKRSLSLVGANLKMISLDVVSSTTAPQSTNRERQVDTRLPVPW